MRLAMHLSDAVSDTALITLKARATEAQRAEPILADPEGIALLAAVERAAGPAGPHAVLRRRLPASLSAHIAMRARKYDAYTAAFRQACEHALVVSLGCGFDTRYWRISPEPWPYVEVDLPDVIAAKRALLGARASYAMLGCSVLDDAWLESVRARQSRDVLFLAEGLLMYLPKADVVALFQRLARTFERSEIVFEVVDERYTRGVWKKMVAGKMRRRLGTEAGTAYQFGVRDAAEVETYAPGIAVVEEWSYVEDPDVRPRFLRWFRKSRWLSRTQWTVRATLG